MANDVNISIGGDAKKAEKAFDQLNEKVAKLESRLKETGKKSKNAGDTGSASFLKMTGSVIGLTSALALASQAFTGAINKAKALRVMSDTATVSVDASFRNLYTELGLKDEKKQAEFKSKVFATTLSKKLKLSRVTDLLKGGAREGLTQDDITSGKIDPLFDLLNIADNIDAKDIFPIAQSALLKQGIKNPGKKDYDAIAKKLAVFKGEFPELKKLMADTFEVKNLALDDALTLFELSGKGTPGDKGKSISGFIAAFKKGGLKNAIKSTGFSESEFEKSKLDRLENEKTSLSTSRDIFMQGRNAEDNLAQTGLDRAFDKKYSDEKLETTLAKETAANQKNVNALSQFYRNTFAELFGQQTAEFAARDLGANISDENIARIQYVSDAVGGFYDHIKGVFSGENESRTLRETDKAINMSGDSKSARGQ